VGGLVSGLVHSFSSLRALAASGENVWREGSAGGGKFVGSPLEPGGTKNKKIKNKKTKVYYIKNNILSNHYYIKEC
jgi:hypothetical protein